MTEITGLSSEMQGFLSQLIQLSGTRIAFLTQLSDYVLVTYKATVASDYAFQAFLYEEGALEISARTAEGIRIWSLPFEAADFDTPSEMWSAFREKLVGLFENRSHVRFSVTSLTVTGVCEIELPNGQVISLGGVSYAKYLDKAQQLIKLQARKLGSDPIPMT